MTTIWLQTLQTISTPTASTGIDISIDTYGFSSSTPPNPTIFVSVYGLDTGDQAVIQIEDSVNAFSSLVVHKDWTVTGPIGATSPQGEEDDDEGESTAFPINPVNLSVSWRDMPAIRWGRMSAVLRVNVTSLSGSSPHLTYQAWFTY
jgi:hypothetical protein